jgi:CxxC motif-containing protein (DUF1111 family)
VRTNVVVLLALAACFAGCSSSSAPATTSPDAGFGVGDPVDVPIDGLTKDEVDSFFKGDELFDLVLLDPDGLGPLYTRTSCGGCHSNGLRGPGLVQKMSVVDSDGITPSADQSKLPFGATVHPLVTAGAKTPIVPPVGDPSVKVSTRVGPPVLGRGYIEAIDDAEILRAASAQSSRTDAIHGRVNHVTYASEPNPDTRFHAHKKGDVLIGRFGVKARVAALDDFAADALQGDMGITSPLRPVEIPNPDMLTDDVKPGIDVTADSVNLRAMYTRLIAIPRRDVTAAGRALFEQVKCSACHVPSMKTRADYPIVVLAGIDAPVYTDLLLHDMGDLLADGLSGPDGEAGPRDWRTTPLIGLRFDKTFMHDGRARSLAEAIAAHDGTGSEASKSVHLFQALSSADAASLLAFVGAL